MDDNAINVVLRGNIMIEAAARGAKDESDEC